MALPHTDAHVRHTDTVLIDGRTLCCADIERIARGDAAVRLDDKARKRAQEAWQLAEHTATLQPVYGRTTGVGSKRHEKVDEADARGHGLRLLRSHAAGVGPLHSPGRVRAALAIRLNQLAAGGSGVHPRVLEALEGALRRGVLPVVHQYGTLGSADLTALAEIALTLAGERPWAQGDAPPVNLSTGDALAFMSSSAVTLAGSVHAGSELRQLLRANHAVTALSFLALGGNAEAYAATVHRARAHPGQVHCAAEIRRLLALDTRPAPGRRIQDPYGLRAFPQVQGPALESLDHLERVLNVEINARSENPLVDTDEQTVFHHGHFHTAYVATALDQVRATVHHVAALSATLLRHLAEPAMTELPLYLAEAQTGSSGVVILDYVAHDALARMHEAARPATLASAVVSRGLEDHAGFASHAARLAETTVEAFRQVLACILVVAVRALRMGAAELPDIPARAAYELAAERLPADLEDRSLTEDVYSAVNLLPRLAAI
ncbi:aromatic amino acid ammonia-lyase [Streptomyces sp. NPDC098085]|uniref:aromatic amino acid ammonia-lyase n=1 Tax=Streptomyces sp. NPDC098085 TaxID=3366094 RepID=UPI0037FA58CC